MREWLLRLLVRPAEAMLVVAALAWLGRLFLPMLIVEQGLLALLTLRHGVVAAFQIWASAVVVLVVLIVLSGASLATELPPQVLVSGLVILAAACLRLGVPLSTAIVVTALGVLFYVAVLRWVLVDVDRFWLEALLRWADSPAMQAQGPELKAIIERTAPWMNTTLAALMFLCVVAALSLGRYWQWWLADGSRFGAEFLRLRLGPRLSGLGFAAFVLAWQGLIWREVLVIAGGIGGLVGLAIMHAQVSAGGLGVWAPIGLYVGMVLVPPLMLPPLVVVGFVDAWMDFRGLRRGSPP